MLMFFVAFWESHLASAQCSNRVFVGVQVELLLLCKKCAFGSSRKSILLKVLFAKSGLEDAFAAASLVIVCFDSGADLASSEARFHDSGSHWVNAEAAMEVSL